MGDCFLSLCFAPVRTVLVFPELFISAFIYFITFPVGQKFTYTQIVFGRIAFKLFNLGQTFRVAFQNLFWPIPSDIAGVTESSL